MSGYVLLEDGTRFDGEYVGADAHATGEVVFTTGMAGYQESVTDPSFAGQLVAFTAPMIGNYGVDDARLESPQPWVKAALMRRCGGVAWAQWLASRGIVALEDIDTRKLVLRIREAGAMRAAAVAHDTDLDPGTALELIRQQPTMEGQALVSAVSSVAPTVFNEDGRVRVAVVNYGAKTSIMRRLRRAGAAVTVFPHLADPDELAGFDGVLLSNGPGDPEPLAGEVEAIRGLLGRTSVLGICLGHQLLGLATGHETYKLPFGHRGANHPVYEAESGRVLVTSQNHGFAVKAPENGDGALEVTHRSLYDGTVEGLRLRGRQVWSMQFHPEASPGPHDAREKLSEFVEACAARAGGNG